MKKGELGRKRLINLIILVGIAILIYLVSKSSGFSLDKVTSLMDSSGLFGPIVFIIIILIHGIFSFFPVAVLVFFAGSAYGIFNATIYSMIGLTIGATLAFFIGRTYGEGVEKKWISSKGRRHINEMFEKYGVMIAFFGRMSIVLPADTISIASGTTEMNFWKFIAASFLGFLPLVLLFAFVGAKVTEIITSMRQIVLVAVVIIAFILIARYWHKIFDYFTA